MAGTDEVKIFMNVRLAKDNFKELLKAGDAWNLKPMVFYYFDESQVDIATKEVMLTILKRENKTLSNDQWAELREQNNLATVVNDVIDSITIMSVKAKRFPSNP